MNSNHQETLRKAHEEEGSPFLTIMEDGGDFYLVLKSKETVEGLLHRHACEEEVGPDRYHVYAVMRFAAGSTEKDALGQMQFLLNNIEIVVEEGKIALYVSDPRSGHLDGAKILRESRIVTGVRRIPVTKNTSIGKALYEAAWFLERHWEKARDNHQHGLLISEN